jgi:ABC-type uncharacterized transport system auxiliary subunit
MIQRRRKMKYYRRRGMQRIRKPFLFFLFITLLFYLIPLTGCLNLQKPARYVEQYVLEYPSPEISGLSLIDTTIKVERFSEVSAFSTSAMIYRPEPFKLEAYQYHRWRVHPADLVTDFVVRDLKKAALFRAVFSYPDQQDGRFILEGGVEEFLETDEKNQREALLALSITLLDSSAREIPNRILFQKRYRFLIPIEENTPRGLAKGMSQAMQKFSESLIRDIHASIQPLQK